MSHINCLRGISVVCSHEILETLIDPIVSHSVLWETVATNTQTLVDEVVVFSEIGDPAQGQFYLVNDSYSSFPVQNFIGPSWFDQLANTGPNSDNVVYDFLRLFNKPGQVSAEGYISYSNKTDGCEYYYQPNSDLTQHDRVIQDCSYRRCICPFATGTVIGSDAIDYSFANVFGNSRKSDMIIKTILDQHLF